MATTEEDLKSFSQFVQQRIDNEEATDSSLPELFDLWMLQNPTDESYLEDVAAINASINDFMNGERGTPAGEDSRRLREEFGISPE
ncbi:MAG: hypothetical protein ACKVHE_10755 [Planctomycetales bacterium]|jgi:hypothetical protein